MRACLRLPAAAAIAAFTLAPFPPSLDGAEGEFRVAAGQRQLFLEEYGIETIENLRRTMHRPLKRGAVVRSPIASQGIQTRTAPVWDPDAKLYKLPCHGAGPELSEHGRFRSDPTDVQSGSEELAAAG